MIAGKKLSYLRMSNKSLLVIALFLSSFKICWSQTIIKGIIKDDNQKVLPYVNVTIKKVNHSSVISYSYSNEVGDYDIKIEANGIYILSFSMMGYETKKIDINIKNSESEIIQNVVLNEKAFTLDEVIITADKPIKVKKDTIVFNAKYFTVGNEETVEDLLKKIPGISIDNNGTIRIGNQEIEKLMVDGDDLFEKGYKILSKNMPSYPVDKIEVLNKYSNNRLLKDVEQSDKVALNLKLKEKFKRIWFGSINVGYSAVLENNYEAKLNLANFGKKNKYYFITNFNNVGYDATGDIENLIRPFRINEPASIGDNQSVNSLLNLSPNQLNFKQSRTNFNNAELFSLNAIFNPTEKLKIKTLGFFNWDETDFFRNSTDIVDVNGTNLTNTEH